MNLDTMNLNKPATTITKTISENNDNNDVPATKQDNHNHNNNIKNLQTKKCNTKSIKIKHYLPYDYIPNDNDVICDRGSNTYNHIGNIKFRILVKTQLHLYNSAQTKFDKSLLICSIIDKVRNNNNVRPSGDFIKNDKDIGLYYKVGDFYAVSINFYFQITSF